jgi:hypothetical protein
MTSDMDGNELAWRKCRAIEAVFARLPAGSDEPVKQLIPEIAARHLLHMDRGPRPRLPEKEERRLRNLPPVMAPDSLSLTDWEMLSRRPRPPSIKAALSALERKTGCAIEALSDPVLAALKGTSLTPLLYQLKMDLGRMHVVADPLRAEIKTKKSPPEKVEKTEIARVVGQYYYYRTGEPPKVATKDGVAYGRFLKTLAAIYTILGIKRGSEGQARKVAKEWAGRDHKNKEFSPAPQTPLKSFRHSPAILK